MDDDERRAKAIDVIALNGTSEYEVRINEDGLFTGTVEAVRWMERWVGASDVARSPGRVTFPTAARFMERVAKLRPAEAGYKDHRIAETVTEAIRTRERAEKAEPVLVGQESDRTKLILALVAKRIVETRAKHGPFHCAHEIYGVLAEEVAEFFDEVRADSGNARKLAELVDIATVALRGAIELAESMDHEPTEAEIRNA